MTKMLIRKTAAPDFDLQTTAFVRGAERRDTPADIYLPAEVMMSFALDMMTRLQQTISPSTTWFFTDNSMFPAFDMLWQSKGGEVGLQCVIDVSGFVLYMSDHICVGIYCPKGHAAWTAQHLVGDSTWARPRWQASPPRAFDDSDAFGRDIVETLRKWLADIGVGV